jgi:hypothetical protein
VYKETRKIIIRTSISESLLVMSRHLAVKCLHNYVASSLSALFSGSVSYGSDSCGRISYYIHGDDGFL